jgi:hypothetical protein
VHEEISVRELQPAMVYTVVEPLHIERMSIISLFKIAVLIALTWCVYVGAVLVLLAMTFRGPAVR